MAHGFLSYEEVSGDRFWQNAKWLGKQLDKIRKAKIWPLSDKKIVNAYVSELQNLLVSGQQKKMAATPQTRMLGAGAGELATKSGGLVEKNPTNIDVKTGERPPSGPRLPSGGGPSKGGGFTNIPGIASSGLNAESFFQKAQTGVGASGEYLTKAQRIADFRKSQEMRSASAGSPPITGDSGLDIVAAVNRNTQLIVSLVDAVKEQTKTQIQLSEKESQNTEKLMLRAAARQEEDQLEQGKDLSGFLTATKFKNKEKKSGGGGDDSLLDFLDVGLDLLDIGGGRRGKGGRSKVTTGRGGKGGGISRGLGKASKGGGLARGAAGLGKGLLRNAGPLALLGGAFEFSGRKAEGQSNLQAGVGTAASVAGGLAGAAKGAAMGAALGSVVPGLGTAVGGVLGGLIGGFGGSALAGGAADLATGAFANGGLITQPTLSLMGEGNRAEGVFPLEGTRGKKTFEMFGEGVFAAQKKNDKDFAKIQAMGLKQYYEREGGFEKMAEGLKDFFAGLGGVFKNIFDGLTGGAARAGTLDQAGEYLGGGVGGSTAERNAAAFLSTLEGGAGQTAADTFQVMLNRTANAKAGGSMKAYGTSLFDQITAREQFSPFSAAIYGGSADSAAARKYGPITKALGKTPEERKRRLLEIAGQPDGIAALQKLFKAGSASAAAKVLADFESGGEMSKSSAQFVGGAMSFRGYETKGSRRRAEGGNYIFGAAQGTKAASLSAVSAAPDITLDTGRLPKLPRTGTMHGQAYGANRKGGRKHAGVDFDISGNEKFFSRIGGEVIFAGWGGSGYGNTVDIYNKDLNVTERIAEGAKLLVSQGQNVSPGTAVTQGESNTGVIHYEIRKGRATASGSFEGTLNPLNFLSSISSKNKDTAKTGGGQAKPASATVNRGGQRGGGSSPGSLQASAANPNTGTPMMAASQQVAMGTMGLTTQGGGATIINNYYGGGQQGGINGNGVSPGIGMDQTGTAIFQELRIRALA